MKPTKGISQSTHPIDQPKDTIFYGKNGIIYEKLGSHVNEPGFLVSTVSIPFTVHGIIELVNQLIIFSTDNINSVIGIYDQETGLYTEKINRTDLGFNFNFPITGIYKKDYKDDIIIVFTDNNVPPKYINLGNITITDTVNDYLLFPNSIYPTYTSIDVISNNGQIKSGTKYFVLRYKNNDGSVSNFVNISQPIIIVLDSATNFNSNTGSLNGSESGLTTSKSINLEFSNLDINYDKLQIGLIEKTDTLIDSIVRIVGEIDINITSSFTYTGNESFEEVPLDDVLVNRLNYNRIGTFGTVDNVLYAADLTGGSLINYQRYANLIEIEYTSKSICIYDAEPALTDFGTQRISAPKGFQHGEVYSLYIALILNDSTETSGFHIPGRVSSGIDKDTSEYSFGQANGTFANDKTVLKYQVEDTTSGVLFGNGFSGAGTQRTGKMGFWENLNETYPDVPEFDSSALSGGTNLRGQKVRHHVFPTIGKCKNSHYYNSNRYGLDELDVLGINVKNVIFPPEIASQIQGYKIYYAKRGFEDAIVQGQSLLQFAAFPGNPISGGIGFTDQRIYTTGGNWSKIDSDWSPVKALGIIDAIGNGGSYIRHQSLDIKINKPTNTPSYIRNELKLRVTNLQAISNISNLAAFNMGFPPEWPSNATYGRMDADNGTDTAVYFIDYAARYSSYPTAVTTNVANYIKAITSKIYLTTNHAVPNSYWNVMTESAAVYGINNNGSLGLNINQAFGNSSESGLTGVPMFLNDFEETYLTSICQYKTDVYKVFSSQELVATNKIQSNKNITFLNDIFGGDTFTDEYSYVTVGPRCIDDSRAGANGNTWKFIRRFICESVNPAGFRIEDPANNHSRFYPKSGILQVADKHSDSNFDYNQWANIFNKDFTSVNDLNPVFTNDVEDVNNNSFPYRIIFSNKANQEEQKEQAWKTFPIDNFYEIVKDKGKIIHLQGYDTDKLIIQTLYDCFITRGVTQLNTGGIDSDTPINISTAAVFSIPPKQLIQSKDGRFGCQHKFGCKLTPLGYIAIDSQLGDIWLFNGKAKKITTGLEVFLRDNLRVVGDNPFVTNGMSMAYDEKYERLIISIKNNASSFTISYSNEVINYFHSYIPDIVTNTRNKLFSFKYNQELTANRLYIHNEGPRGLYYDRITPEPFFIDVVFKLGINEKGESITGVIEDISWITEVTQDNIKLYNSTIDAITVRTPYSTTGKKILTKDAKVFDLVKNNRNQDGTWNFNDIRDILINRDVNFTKNIFNDYKIEDTMISENQSWFNKREIEDKFFIVRFEYSNEINKELILHEVFASARKTVR